MPSKNDDGLLSRFVGIVLSISLLLLVLLLVDDASAPAESMQLLTLNKTGAGSSLVLLLTSILLDDGAKFGVFSFDREVELIRKLVGRRSTFSFFFSSTPAFMLFSMLVFRSKPVADGSSVNDLGNGFISSISFDDDCCCCCCC